MFFIARIRNRRATEINCEVEVIANNLDIVGVAEVFLVPERRSQCCDIGACVLEQSGAFVNQCRRHRWLVTLQIDYDPVVVPVE